MLNPESQNGVIPKKFKQSSLALRYEGLRNLFGEFGKHLKRLSLRTVSLAYRLNQRLGQLMLL